MHEIACTMNTLAIVWYNFNINEYKTTTGDVRHSNQNFLRQ